jgi:hypothetical protein
MYKKCFNRGFMSYIKHFILSNKRRFYKAYFSFFKGWIDLSTYLKFRGFGLASGTIFLELNSALKAVRRRLKYLKDPIHYGLNQFNHEHQGKHPVILIHGRMGKWTDLMGLARRLQNAQIPVFLLTLQNSTYPSEADRTQINELVKEIRIQYFNRFNEAPPRVDLVGHSLGGDMALYTAFAVDCSYIEEKDFLTRGDLQLIKGKQPELNPFIRKVITVGMPSSSQELEWIKATGKERDLFNVVAKFDAVIGHKKSALSDLRPNHVFFVNSGHLGILNSNTYQQVMHWLLAKRQTHLSKISKIPIMLHS